MVSIGKVAKFAIKTTVKVGVASFAIKKIAKKAYLFGFDFGQAFQMMILSEINRNEPLFTTDILEYYKETYGMCETRKEVINKTIDFIHNSDSIDDHLANDSYLDKAVRYASRFITGKLMNEPDIKDKYIISQHQDYLRKFINNNKEAFEYPFMALELRDPITMGYEFEFDPIVLRMIAFNNNVLYLDNKFRFYGPEPLIKRLGENFWTDYNLIAMENNLPCIDLAHYTPDKFVS